jgi:hypothetical protein
MSTSPSIGLHLKLGMASSVTLFSINTYAMLFSDERLRTYRCNYCYSRYRCSFIAFRFSRWALACYTESNRDTNIVVFLIMNFLRHSVSNDVVSKSESISAYDNLEPSLQFLSPSDNRWQARYFICHR